MSMTFLLAVIIGFYGLGMGARVLGIYVMLRVFGAIAMVALFALGGCILG